MNLIDKVDAQTMGAKKGAVPPFKAGDTLKVHVKVTEGTRTRIQVFEGVCIARHNKGATSSFTVRKVSFGEGVERVFPLYAPIVDAIEVVRHGDVRRAKLYYLRGLTGKKARIAENVRSADMDAMAAIKAAAASPAAPAAEEAPADEQSASEAPVETLAEAAEAPVAEAPAEGENKDAQA